MPSPLPPNARRAGSRAARNLASQAPESLASRSAASQAPKGMARLAPRSTGSLSLDGAIVLSSWWALLRTLMFGIASFALACFGIGLLAFGYWLLFFGAIVLCIGVMCMELRARPAWCGHCPYCRAALFTRAPAHVDSHGFDCSTCKQRIVLSENRFLTLEAAMFVARSLSQGPLSIATQKRTSVYSLRNVGITIAVVGAILLS